MLEFLHDTSILTSAKKLIEEGERIDLAVAYWGKGAKDRLNVTTAKRTRIICDLLSGSCNPDEIRGLVDVSSESGIQVRHLDRLHAKIYWTPTAVIVGSANASANGLGDESRLGAIEAALMTDNASALKSVEEWFQSKWEQARPINEHLLEEGRKAWDGGTIGYPVDTVLDVYVRDPERFRRRVWLTYFWSEGSHAAEKRFNEIKQQFYSPRQLARINDENLPVYDLDTSDVSSVRIGDVVVDVWDRLYEVLEIDHYSDKKSIVLLKPKDTVMGLKFPEEQRALFEQAIERYLATKERALGRKLTDVERDFGCNIEDLQRDFNDVHLHLIRSFIPRSDEGQK